MFNTISFERLLEVTAEDLNAIRDNLGIVYMNETIDSENKNVALATAFNTIDSWSSYFSKFKEIQESKLDEFNRANASLVNENKKLNNELNIITDKYNKQTELVGKLQATIEYQNKLIEAKNNSGNLVSIDLVETLNKLDSINKNFESAISAAQHDAARKVYRQRVASGEVTPAKRLDVDDEVIKTEYLAGATPNAIAKQFGMTQPAIIYRLKKMGIYVDGGRRNK